MSGNYTRAGVKSTEFGIKSTKSGIKSTKPGIKLDQIPKTNKPSAKQPVLAQKLNHNWY